MSENTAPAGLQGVFQRSRFSGRFCFPAASLRETTRSPGRVAQTRHFVREKPRFPGRFRFQAAFLREKPRFSGRRDKDESTKSCICPVLSVTGQVNRIMIICAEITRRNIPTG